MADPAIILQRAREQHIMLTTAESCTGGMIAARFTDIAGSSDVFDRGFVTYSNEAKQDMLGVTAESLSRFGAVSSAVAKEMAYGALARSRASIAISVTGIAGPGGGSVEKPVGTVWFGLALEGGDIVAHQALFKGLSRDGVRQASVEKAMNLIHDSLTSVFCPSQ